MQISLSALLVVISYCAVFCVAILNSGPTSVMILRGIAIGSLLFALLAIWYRRNERRAYWVGYLHGGGAYALLTFYALGGVTQRPVWNEQQLILGEMAKAVYRWLPESRRPATSVGEGMIVIRSKTRAFTSLRIAAGVPPNFRYLFHSAFVVLCGWLGALVGVWAYRTRDPHSAAVVAKTDDLRVTKEALLGIAKAPIVTNGDERRKIAAFRRLAMFVDSEEVVRLLVAEITFRQERSGAAKSPLDCYPAAQALATGGATVRTAILSVPADRFLSDLEVALRAHVLVAVDGERDIAVHRLRRIVEQVEANGKTAAHTSHQPSAAVQDPAKMRLNLGRILAYIEDPAFRANAAIVDPLIDQ